jgi:phage/plasmid-like protein (TIGR03299 family)
MTLTASKTTSTLAGFMKGRTWIGHAAEARTYDGPVPTEDALELLSFPVAEGSVHIEVPILMPDGVETLRIDAKDRKATVRTDTQQVFGLFKKGYTIHPYPEWLVKNLDTITHGGLEIGTVAIVKGGAMALVQAELPEGRMATAPGAEPVAHRPHVFAATSLDGSTSTTYGTGTTALICENQVTVFGVAALGKTTSHKIRHSAHSLSRVFEIRANLGLVVEEIGDEFEAEFRALAAQSVSDAKFRELVKQFTGVEVANEGRSKTIAQNKENVLLDLWFNDGRVAPWRGNAYGVLAAFNTANNHIFGADKDRTDRNHTRLIRGQWAKLDRGALALAGAHL